MGDRWPSRLCEPVRACSIEYPCHAVKTMPQRAGWLVCLAGFLVRNEQVHDTSEKSQVTLMMLE